MVGGRDPAELRRSRLWVGPPDPWTVPATTGQPDVPAIFEDFVERFAAAGIGEFVLCWPPPELTAAFEHIALR